MIARAFALPTRSTLPGTVPPEFHCLSGHLWLDVAQRDRQRRIRIELDDPEPGRKLGERRCHVGLDGEREALLVDQPAAGVVAQVAGDLELELRLLGERPGEGDLLHELAVLLRIGQRGLVQLAVGAAQHRLLGRCRAAPAP